MWINWLRPESGAGGQVLREEDKEQRHLMMTTAKEGISG